MLQYLLMLRILLCLSKYCKVFERFANIAKCCIVFHKEKKVKKFANVTEPTNMAEFLQMWQNLQRFSNVANIAGSLRLCSCCKTFFKKKVRNKKNVMLQSLQRWQNFMLQCFQCCKHFNTFK